MGHPPVFIGPPTSGKERITTPTCELIFFLVKEENFFFFVYTTE